VKSNSPNDLEHILHNMILSSDSINEITKEHTPNKDSLTITSPTNDATICKKDLHDYYLKVS